MEFKTYFAASELPPNWDNVIGQHNLLLSSAYFKALDVAKPANMQCYYIGFYTADELIGGAIIQYLDFEQHNTFQLKKISCTLKNYLTKRYAKDVFILGNNMLTGQNGFYFNMAKITQKQAGILLASALAKVQQLTKPSSLVIYKDYQAPLISQFLAKSHKSYFKFSVQPNMVLNLRPHWFNFENYLEDFSAKYRTRANAARKKLGAIQKIELDLAGIETHEQALLLLYQTVAENAPFNTFFLPSHHFGSLKKHLGNNFKVFGYFMGEKLIGFYSLIINKNDIDTYFLGYTQTLQKEKQLYLNMLLDMVAFGINHQMKRIIFGRTALEIKSTIGATPVEIFGLIKHNLPIINQFMPLFFPQLDPKIKWEQRQPFK